MISTYYLTLIVKLPLHRVWLRLLNVFVVACGVLLYARSSAQPGYADLQVSYANSTIAATLGQYFKCSVSLYNAGWDTATNCVATNQLPAGIEFVSASCSRGVCTQAGGQITWTLGNFSPYQSATLTMEFKAIGISSYTNVAVAASATPDPNSTNSQASFSTLVTQARFFGVGSTHIAFYSRPTLTLMTNNQVLVVGQHLGKTTDLYNMSSRTFSLPAGTMVGVHEYGSATVLTNGLVLLAGGATATGTKTAELYNPATQLFRQVGDMLVYSYDHYATLQPNGTVLLCGLPSTNELFNPVTENFSLAPTMQCAFNGIYLSTGKYLYFNYGRAYLYDTNTSTSVETSGFLQPRAYHTATLLSNGKVLIAGGYGTWGATTGPLSSAELYDPVTDRFTKTASLTGPREHLSACLLPDGTVLVAGGMVSESNPFSLTAAEVYDPNGSVNVPGIIVNDASVVEGDSGSNWMQFNVSLTTNSAFPVTVNFATATGTAGTVDWGVANVDFVSTNGTLTFPPGVTNAIINVAVFGDLIWEPSETYTVNLSLPTQAWIARATATGTILNNDPLPTLSVLPGSLPESDLARSNMTLQVSLSLPTPSTVIVDYFTADASAGANSDYLPTSGTLAFGAGTTTMTVEVPVIGDLLIESDETFSLNISNAQNAVIAGSSALGTILNDDAVPGHLHHFDWSVIPSPQVQAAGFPVTVTAKDYFGDVVTNVPWPVRLSGQTTNYAATNLDFEGPTLAPWTTFNYTPYEKSFSQRLMDVTGMGPASMAFRTGAGGGTNGIVQDVFLQGGIPYVFSANVLAGREESGDSTCWGGTIYFEVGTNSSSAPLPTLCGGYAPFNISASYTPPTNGIYPLRFTIYRSYFWVSDSYFVYLDDVQISHPVVTPTVATNFTNGVWTGVVTALQAGTNISLLANDNAGHKGNSNPFDVLPGTDLGLSVGTNWAATLRTGDRLTFNLAVTNRGPSAVSDAAVHWTIPTNLTFLSSSNLQGTITNEGGQLRWTVGSLAVGSNVTASVLMRADFPGLFTNAFAVTNSVADVNTGNNFVAVPAQVNPPLLAIGDASATEANGAATGIIFPVTLSGPSGQTISVDYFTVNGSATNSLDFAATNGTVTFAPFVTNVAIRVFAIEDILDEPNRSFTVQLTNVVNAIISDAIGAGTVLDDDAPPTISIADMSVLEGDSGTVNAVFQLTLSKLAIVNVSVTCATATNTALSGSDYTHTSGSVVFPAGTTNATFSVPVRGNTVSESNETFFVNLSSPANATIADGQAVGTILNDDAVPGRLDHFVWDPIASPKYRGLLFPVVLRGLDYAGNPATTGYGSVLATVHNEAGFAERMTDDFEDGNSFGWTNFNASLSAIVTNETAAGGALSLRLTGGTGSHFNGLRRTFTNSRPNRIQFAVRASRTNLISGRLTAVGGAGYRAAQFQMHNNGLMGLVNSQGAVTGVPYQSNRWYQVALDLNWTTRRVDCRIDGTLAVTNFAFPDDPYSGLDWVTIANLDITTTWWDDFRIFNDNLTNATTITPSNLFGFVNGVWSNNVVLNQAGTNIFLTVDDGLEHVGTSGFFDVFPVTLTLVTPATVSEGDAPVAAQVRIPVPSTQPIVVTLTSSVPSELTVPPSVTILAGQTNANFNLTIVDDALLDGTQLVNVSATASNLVSATNTIAVTENESAGLTLLVPANALENVGTLAGAGRVTASSAPNKNATVTLTSSDTNVVQVPASVVIPSNQTSVTFNVTIVDDQRIDGTQQATITASIVNWTNDSKIVTVTDNENAHLNITGPAQLSENGGSASYTARIPGTLTTNLTATLSSSDTNILTVPPSVLIPAGQTSVVFSVTILDNALFDGMRVVTLFGNAPGFTGTAPNVNVLDNEVHHLGFSAISGIKTSSVAFPVTISTRDINDGPITAFTGQVTLSGIAGGIVIVQPTNVFLLNGSGLADVTVFTAEPLVTLQAQTTNGLVGTSNPFNVSPPDIFYANVAGGDLVYSPASERLWALASGTLVPIDPLRQFIEPAVPILAGAGRLATAGDGRYIHVIVNSGTPNVRRFDTLTRTVNLSWTNSGLSIEDIAVSPTNSDLVAISWACPGCSPRGRGVFLYQNGVLRTNGFSVNSVEFGEDPGRLYGYNNDVYGTSYQVARVDASGITFEGRVPILGGWSDDFTVSGGVMFGFFGGAFNPENGAVLGNGNWFGQTADKAAGRLFGIDYFGRIYATDLATLQSLGMMTIPSVTNPGRLVRWGTNGLAFPGSGKIVITRPRFLPAGPATDLALSISAAKFSVQTSNTFPCSLVISNRGPNPANNALLALTLPANVSLLTATPSIGSVTQLANGLVCALNTLPAGAQASLALTLRAGMPGFAIGRASLTSETTDPDPTNNLVNLAVEVGYAPGLDTITEIRQATTDLAWNSNANKIVVSVQNIPATIGESLLLLDPWTGQFDAPISVGHQPSKLSVHPAGRYAYAALDGEAQITRVDFSNRVADLKFPTGFNYTADLAVQPDNPARVAATVHTRVAVYENGVLLPNTVEPTAWNWDYFLEFSSISPTMLYCAYPDGLRRIQVTTNGANLLEDVGGLIAGFDRNMRSDGGRVFTDGGRVFDPETHTLIATVPYSGLVAPDADGGRVFYLTGSGTNYTLTALDFTNLQFVGSLSISNISGTPTSLIRWGEDGLAFRTTGGQIFLIRTTLADDRDQDALPDSWELQYFGGLGAPGGGASDDPDLDGFTNLQEARAGLDPHQFDNLRLRNARLLPGGLFRCEVIAQPGGSYALLTSTNLVNWTLVQRFDSTNVVTTLIDAIGADKPGCFYRVGP